MSLVEQYKEFKLQMDARAATSDEFQSLRARSIQQIRDLALLMSDVKLEELDRDTLEHVDRSFDQLLETAFQRAFMFAVAGKITRNSDVDFTQSPIVDKMWEAVLHSLEDTLRHFNR